MRNFLVFVIALVLSIYSQGTNISFAELGEPKGHAAPESSAQLENARDHARADRNFDGQIDGIEARKARDVRTEQKAGSRHDALDKNDDGRAGLRERAWAEAQMDQENAAGTSHPWQDKADLNSDDMVDAFEQRLAQKHMNMAEDMQQPAAAPAAFQAGESFPLAGGNPPADFNNDGHVGLAEARHADNLFESPLEHRREMADRNNDGRIGEFERKAAREHFENNLGDGKGNRNQDGKFDRLERQRAKEAFGEQGSNRAEHQPGGPGFRDQAHEGFGGEQRGGAQQDNSGMGMKNYPGSQPGGPMNEGRSFQGGPGPSGHSAQAGGGQAGPQGGQGDGSRGGHAGGGPGGRK